MHAIRLRHLRRMTDDTGLIQHAYYGVPRRDEGYSADDNARALILVARLFDADRPDDHLIELAATYLAFLQHAQGDGGLFWNFMHYNRTWLDVPAGEDCQARCLWATAEVRASALPDDLRLAAWDLFRHAVENVHLVHHPRAQALTLLALHTAARVDEPGTHQRAAADLTQNLLDRLLEFSDGDWTWFDDRVVYDNARLPHGLLAAGELLERDDLVRAGLRALEFLTRATMRDGMFHPVGNRGWYPRGGRPAEFDQQPIEAQAMAEAALDAWRLSGKPRWRDVALAAGRWFLGANALGEPLADPATGSCRDGLMPEGVNGNCGAESTLAWLATAHALASCRIDLQPTATDT